MSFDSLLIHTLTIRRAASDGTVDEYGQPVTAPVDVATVPGLIQPIRTQDAAQEVAIASQAGTPIATHVAFLRPLAGLASDCWIEYGGRRYDFIGDPQDAGGRGHHLEIKLRSVG